MKSQFKWEVNIKSLHWSTRDFSTKRLKGPGEHQHLEAVSTWDQYCVTKKTKRTKKMNVSNSNQSNKPSKAGSPAKQKHIYQCGSINVLSACPGEGCNGDSKAILGHFGQSRNISQAECLQEATSEVVASSSGQSLSNTWLNPQDLSSPSSISLSLIFT